jgi:ketosteroid isomerase-like protein
MTTAKRRSVAPRQPAASTLLAACFLLGPIALWAGAGAVHAREASPARDVDALKALMREYTAAYEGRKTDAVMATLDGSSDLALFLPNPFAPMLLEGTTTGREIFATFFASIPASATFRMATHDDAYRVHGDIGINTNYTTIYLQVGGLSRNYTCRTTNLFKRTNGQWKIVHIHGSPVPKESDYLTTFPR